MINFNKRLPLLFLLAALVTTRSWGESLHWTECAGLPPASGNSERIPFAGAYAGVSNDALIIAGGAHRVAGDPLEKARLFDDIVVLPLSNAESPDSSAVEPTPYAWRSGFHLDSPLAFGASASTDQGLVCLGGWNGTRNVDDAFLMTWDAERRTVHKTDLPSLPLPSRNCAAAAVGTNIYVAALEPGASAAHFWRLNLEHRQSGWQELPTCPSEADQSFAVSQHNGENDCFYLICQNRSNSNADPARNGASIWEFNPARYDRGIKNSAADSFWRKMADAPPYANISAALPIGQGFIFAFGANGDDNTVGIFHTITNTWVDGGAASIRLKGGISLVWHNRFILSGVDESSTAKLWFAQPTNKTRPFGAINFAVLILYLIGMAGVGLYFMRKNKNTEDYFRGGQSIPWWVAGCSIFATMLSSITYMALPAKAFAVDWTYLLSFPIILLVSIFVITLILPFFRRINATSAYEYLELRFNLGARLLGSSLFILFHIGRMAIVLYLSALALAAITPFTQVQAILIMGLFSLLYSTLGGIEAVVWTDTIQTFVLFGGAIIILIFAIQRIDGGFVEMARIAAADGKFTVIHWDWDKMSYTVTAFWVILFGGIGQNLVSYTSDQAVVQRYMTTPDEKTAAKAILTNGILSQPVGLLFLALGAALFVFYKMHPAHLDPTFKIDAVMPMFIAQELPVGVAGLIVAGIFAAAQSTVSTSMNSTATAFITDFIRRFSLLASERAYFNLARTATLLFGAAGVALAVLLAGADIKSMLDSFFSVIGLFGGSLAGMFLLGIFTKRTNGVGVLIGAVTGGIVLYLVQSNTTAHVYLYALIGISASMIVGYLFSLPFAMSAKPIDGLSIFSMDKK